MFTPKYRLNLYRVFGYVVSCYILSSSVLSKNTRKRIHRTVTFPVAMNRRMAWSLALREEHTLRVFQNRVLRKAFGPKSEKVTEEWRRLYKG